MQTFFSLFQRCRQGNIKLNKAKFDLKWHEVPDSKKFEAFVNMETPNDLQGVQRLIGMVKYLSKVLNNLSELCEPLANSPTRMLNGSGPRNKMMPSSPLREQLHKRQS